MTSDYKSIKPLEQRIFRATVESDGVVRFTDCFSDGIRLDPSQLQVLIPWLQNILDIYLKQEVTK